MEATLSVFVDVELILVDEDILDVAIIGAGFSGLGTAIRLKLEGKRSFKIFEKAQDVGGTWRENTYPGCACDIPSHLYSFSYAQNPDWSRLYPSQPEIWEYLRWVTRQFALNAHIEFGRALCAAAWNDPGKHWKLRFESGEEVCAKVIVYAAGPLHYPFIPKIEGLEGFKGRHFHSAQWDHETDLGGKDVAVLGTGASAIQIIPEIVDQVKSLLVLQRTPPWVMPRPDRPVRAWEKWLFKHFPFTQHLFRMGIYWLHESRAYAFIKRPALLKFMQRTAKKHIARQIRDPQLRADVTPDYVMGCKRVLISNDYYPALAQGHVKVARQGLAGATPHGLKMADGENVNIDVLIFSTGFEATDIKGHPEFVGIEGRTLAQAWAAGPEAYLGLCVPDFPNLFIMTGPNTGLGHNSVVFMVETMVHYILDALGKMDACGAKAVMVKRAAHQRFNARVQQDLGRTVWASGCKSWYQTADGRNTTLWPGFSVSYWWKTRALESDDFELMI